MADWVHCNKCFLRINSSEKVKFSLTNCGHIYCEQCIKIGNRNVCNICRSDCTTIDLCSNMTPDIQLFFSDIEATMNKFTKVLEFQKNHRARLFDHHFKEHQIMQKKYAHAKEYIKKITKQLDVLQKENQRFRNLLKMSMFTPPPGSGPNKTPTGNSSFTRTPTSVTSGSGNSNRFIIRGQPGQNWTPNELKSHSSLNKSIYSDQNLAMFRTPSNCQSPSSGFRTPTNRSSGIPNGSVYSRPSPSSINMSALSFPGRRQLNPRK